MQVPLFKQGFGEHGFAGKFVTFVIELATQTPCEQTYLNELKQF